MASGPSAVSFLAMEDSDDMDGIRLLGKADAMVTHAQAKLDRLSLQALDVPHTRLREPVQGGENAHSHVLVQTADVRTGLLGEDDSLHVDSLECSRSLTARPKSAKTSSKGIPG